MSDPADIRSITRRSVLWLSAVAVSRAMAPAEVLVVQSAKLPAYTDAFDGLRSALLGQAVHCTILSLDQPGGREQLAAALDRKSSVVVAAGSTAVDAVTSSGTQSPVVAMMVLAPPAASHAAPELTTITLEVPSAAVLERLKHLYPERTRIAIVRGPALSAGAAENLEAASRAYGFHAKVFHCPGPKELLNAFPAMQNVYHFAWCLPDTKLYQRPALSAAILAAIRYRVPIIGFSEGVVRAGAIVGFYPDYREIGRQAGEAVLSRLQGEQPAPVERPRKVTTAVNERVTRVLGIKHARVNAETVVIR